jgi:hypothetical protein
VFELSLPISQNDASLLVYEEFLCEGFLMKAQTLSFYNESLRHHGKQNYLIEF